MGTSPLTVRIDLDSRVYGHRLRPRQGLWGQAATGRPCSAGHRSDPDPGGHAPGQVALSDAAAWVTTGEGDAVQRIDPTTDKAVPIKVGNGPPGSRTAPTRCGWPTARTAPSRAVWVALAG
jgi:hypothetical protein